MRLPKFMYESYPILYVLIGIASMSMVESYMSFLCGFLLALSGISILFMRRNYRIMQDHLTHLS